MSHTALGAFSRGLIVLLVLLQGCAGPAPRPGVGLRQDALNANDRGYHYYARGNLELAREKFAQALRLNRLIDHVPGIAANLNNLGAIYQEQGQYSQAEDCYQEALKLNRQQDDTAGIIETLNNLGTVWQTQGKLRQARAAYTEAQTQAQQPGLEPLLALTLTHCGDLARQEQRDDEALKLYQQALQLNIAHQAAQGRAVSLERLGRIHLDLGNFVQSEQDLKTALQEFRRLESVGGVIDALDGLTRLYLAMGNQCAAQDYGARLAQLYQALGKTDKYQALSTLLPAARQKPQK
ncbi:MAG: tetratricopeptide repeat protein [Desulfobacca sp.]|nr:tetratricopeptide repeat protein [Desulfobacca sp.]